MKVRTNAKLARFVGMIALVAILIPSLRAEAGAQHLPEPIPGDRVRVTTPALVHWDVEGELVSLTADSLRVQPRSGGATLSIPLDQVERFRVSEGQRRATLRGAFIGLIVGFAVGEGIVAAERSDGSIDQACGEQSCRGWGTRFLFTGIGIGVGGLVGSRFHHERWRDLPLREGGG